MCTFKCTIIGLQDLRKDNPMKLKSNNPNKCLNGPVFCSHSKNQDGHHLKFGSDVKIDDTLHIKII